MFMLCVVFVAGAMLIELIHRAEVWWASLFVKKDEDDDDEEEY